jgi:hypothetical protein
MALRPTADYHVIPRKGEALTWESQQQSFLWDFDEIAAVAVAPSQ